MQPIKNLLSYYRPGYPVALVYMLQSTEYQTGEYLKWYRRTANFSRVMHRKTLDYTKPARLLLLTARLGMALQIALGLIALAFGLLTSHYLLALYGFMFVVIYPVIWAYALVLPLIMGRMLITRPAEAKLIEQSKAIFANHPGIKIAVAGSYGKTSMKELLLTVLSEGLDVKATPANKNVSSSHAYFAKKLTGSEDVLIIEYGEGRPGDVARFAEITKPTHAVITGLAAAHLDQYQTIQEAGLDIMSVAEYVEPEHVFVNGESPELQSFIKDSYAVFDSQQALGWTVQGIETNLIETTFSLRKDKKTLTLSGGLVGRHQVGFLAFVAAFALELGLTDEQVTAGIAKTKPFEHRMQPYRLNGAWIVDDTYNGNLEGIRAGTSLLKDNDAKRKMYVTPGLVEQGEETDKIHRQVGQLIGEANPDIVVLMNNSVTGFIQEGLKATNYQGEVRVEHDPLAFYQNLGHFVAEGDLVVMQNDWTDNYA